uniref:ATP-dependent Clp protease proteolytic subunit n=1 Tax=Wollemia nobilis TaxID=56998 RepID=A0A0C9RND0_9CONI
MGSLASSTPLSSSRSPFLQHCNSKNGVHRTIISCRNSFHLPFNSKATNLRLDSHSNASIHRGLGDTHKAVPTWASSTDGRGFETRAYLNEWAAAVGGGGVGVAYAQQTPQMAQRSAEAEVMGLLLRERIIFLGNEMDDFVADAIVSQLLLLDARDPNRDIRLYINCPGGSTSAAMGIFDAIQFCRADVSTVAFGIAASTASIILAGGTRGKRLSMPNARIMVHQPLGGASGDTSSVEIQAKEIMFQKKNVIRIFSEITGRSTEQVGKDLDRDRYMSPLEAVEYGLIDGVIDEDSIMPPTYLPEKVEPRPDIAVMARDRTKFFTVDVPDDEIY